MAAPRGGAQAIWEALLKTFAGQEPAKVPILRSAASPPGRAKEIREICIMADVFSQKKRSTVMSAIRSVDTKPEILVRKLLFASGFRFRLHSKSLPGKPDVVLAKWRTVVFVNGCFWHQHNGCRRAAVPATREGYWLPKLRKNLERDAQEIEALQRQDWRICVVWECACRRRSSEVLREMLEDFIRGDARYAEISRNWSAADGSIVMNAS